MAMMSVKVVSSDGFSNSYNLTDGMMTSMTLVVVI